MDYYKRLDTDPEFAQEMSERQRSIGEWPRLPALREIDSGAYVGAVATFPPNATPLDGKSQLHKVWVGFRYRTDDDDALDAGPGNPAGFGQRRWA